MQKVFYLLVTLLPLMATSAFGLSTEQIKQQIIQESLANYPGNCPCPYNTTRNGRSCGARSAYSRPGGYSPICYPQDVTPQMIKDYLGRANSR
jgi:hypothetical protein